MKKKTLISVFSATILTASAFYLFSINKNSYKKREIANITSTSETVTNIFGLSLEALFENIYSVGKAITSISYQAIKQLVIDHKLISLIHEQNLPEAVETRILNRLEDKKYVIQLVSFLLGIKQDYLDKNKTELLNFKSFIKTKNFSHLSAGSIHSLFSLKEDTKKETNTSSLNLKQLIPAGIMLYDILFIQNDSIIDGEGNNGIYQRILSKDQHIVDQAKPIVESILENILQNTEKGDLRDTLTNILSTDYSLEAATVSLIDFSRGLITKYYYAFLSRYKRRKELANWMLKSYKGDQKDLIKFLQLSLNKNYAVQIVVDGLQGHLLKNLATTDNYNSTFIKQIYKNRLNSQNFKPKNITTIAPAHKPSLKFLANRQVFAFDSQEYLPFFKTLYKEYPNSIATQGVSSTPTISVRNLPIVETGAAVAGEGSTGIPNFHFYDRKKQRAYYFFGNDSLLLNELTKESGMKNMFNRLSRNSTLNCNAIYDELAKSTYDAFINLAVGEKLRDFGEELCFKNLNTRAKIEQQLRSLKTTLLASLEKRNGVFDSLLSWLPLVGSGERKKQLISKIAKLEDQGMPQYLLYYNPWPDHFAHFKGPFSDEIISSTGELSRLDYWLSQLNTIYQESGILEKTLFAMAGDHGLTPVFFALNPEKLFDALNKEFNRNIIVKKISSDEGEGAKINHSYKTNNIHPVDIIVASTAGGNYMMDFFAGPSTQQRERQVYYSDLINWQPLDKKNPINIIHFLTSKLKETLDYLVVRDTESNLQESQTRVIAYRNGQLYDELIIRKQNKIYYKGSKGDLLDIYSDLVYRDKLTYNQINFKNSQIKKCITDAKQADVNSWCSEKQWRILTTLTPRPDSVAQLSHLYDLKRAGSINLFPKQGIGYNTKVPGRHAGESFHEKDAFVGFWGAPINSSKTIQTVENGILAPTIYEYLTGTKAIKGKDGWGFNSVLKDLIQK